ncbi:MAG: hypothetical protein AAFX06_30745 [Planctomycetota bacterium]
MNAPSNKPLDVAAVGVIASELRLPVSRVHDLARQLNIVPAVILNNVPHFARADREYIAAHVREMDRQRSSLSDRTQIQ